MQHVSALSNGTSRLDITYRGLPPPEHAIVSNLPPHNRPKPSDDRATSRQMAQASEYSVKRHGHG